MWKRARLKNIANRSGKPCDVLNFRRQRNYVCSLNKKEKNATFHPFCFKKIKSRFGMPVNLSYLVKIHPLNSRFPSMSITRLLVII